MKYLTLTVFLIFSMYVCDGQNGKVLYSSRAQMKGDTTTAPHGGPALQSAKDTTPSFRNMVFLMQQITLLRYQEDKNAEQIRVLTKMVDSLERRPYLFIDLNKQQPGVWLTNKAGEYMWYIAPINIK